MRVSYRVMSLVRTLELYKIIQSELGNMNLVDLKPLQHDKF